MATNISLGSRVTFIGIGRLVNALVNVLMVPYLARTLTTELYGTYGQVLLIIGIVKVLFSFGLDKLIYRNLNEEKNGEGLVLNTFFTGLLLSFIGTFLLIFGASWLAGFFQNSSLKALLIIFSFSLLFSFAAELLTAILNHFNKVKEIALVSVVSNFIRIATIFITVHYFGSIRAVFWGLLGVEILNFSLFAYFAPGSVFKGRLNWQLIMQQIKVGLPLSLSGVAGMLLVQTDGIMISRMLNENEYAFYRMGAVPIPFLFLVYSSVITITVVEVTKLFSQGKMKEMILLKKNASISVAVLTYPTLIFFLIHSKEFIHIYLGEKYAASHLVFVIYNFLLFLRINDFRDILIASGKTRTILISDISVFLLNIVLNYFLIHSLGIEGAAIASILSYYCLSFSLQFKTARLLELKMFQFFEVPTLIKIIMLSSAVGVAFYFSLMQYSGIYIFAISGLLYTAIVYFLIIRLKLVPLDVLLRYSSQIKLLLPLHRYLLKIK